MTAEPMAGGLGAGRGRACAVRPLHPAGLESVLRRELAGGTVFALRLPA